VPGRSVRRQQRNRRLQDAIEADIPARAGQGKAHRRADIGARRADPQLDLARVEQGEVGVQFEPDARPLACRELDLARGDQLLNRAGDLSHRVVQVHLDHFGRGPRPVILNGRFQAGVPVRRPLLRGAPRDAGFRWQPDTGKMSKSLPNWR
jgi:hypothetical protein